jgi:uncharacterized damage-inducible protein DinB
MQAIYRMFARYNRWANRRLYAAVAALPDADYRADHGAFFRSLEGTLNHVLVGDRVWMRRFTGEGPQPTRLDEILYPEFDDLRAAREAEDDRIVAWVDGLDAAALAARFTYRPITVPEEVSQPLAPALSHFFNHQTHHRGQLHAMITAAGEQTGDTDLFLILDHTF